MSARAAGSPQKLGGAWADYPSQSQKGGNPVDTLISDFWPPDQEERDFCYLSNQVYGVAFWQPELIYVHRLLSKPRIIESIFHAQMTSK